MVDRRLAADRVTAILARIEPAAEDAGRTEDEVMADVLADIAAAREQRNGQHGIAVMVFVVICYEIYTSVTRAL